MKAGQIVKSTAGRDKNTFFVVTEVVGTYAVICDGKHRPLEKPKMKKLKHLSETAFTADLNQVKTNKEFRRVLHRFNFE
ncbi:MAG: KOW domain-containing RNA-binding protein [Clostridia bacterium]|jgi:ribosomal protein L14E/L6E/L27E|nr:KOW domain-containing RNA-binding protein [Clostridia bacterium]MEE1126142.1 KOW domain-containing RNA-binding protein [Acutalibacteraceae bacterium]